MKNCAKCNEYKCLEKFGKDRYKIDGLNSYCKECIKKRNNQTIKNDPEKHKNNQKKYREKNRELIKENAKIDYYLKWDKKRQEAKESYEKHKEKIAIKRAEKSRLAEEKEKNRLRQKKWRSENKSRVSEVVAGWKKRNPQKAAAHTLVLWAIKSGVLTKPECCEECGNSGKIEGHHKDYFKPLEVVWLCKTCHSKKHQKYR